MEDLLEFPPPSEFHNEILTTFPVLLLFHFAGNVVPTSLSMLSNPYRKSVCLDGIYSPCALTPSQPLATNIVNTVNHVDFIVRRIDMCICAARA